MLKSHFYKLNNLHSYVKLKIQVPAVTLAAYSIQLVTINALRSWNFG